MIGTRKGEQDLLEEINKDANDKNVPNSIELFDANQQFMELFRVDILIREMDSFDKKKNPTTSEVFDKSLTKFLLAYRGCSKLIYLEENSQPYNNLLQNVRKQAKIAENLSEKEIKNLSDVFSGKFEQFEKIETVQQNIQALEKTLADLGGNKTISKSSQTDKEALEVLEKLNEKYKDKYKGYKISTLSLGGETAVLTLAHPKKGNVVLQPNLASLKPLNSAEGIERINIALANKTFDTKKKEAVKENNKEIKEQQAEISQKIEKEKKSLEGLKKSLGKEVESHFKNLPDKEFLDIFSLKDHPLKNTLETMFNAPEIKNELFDSLKEEKQIWQYVREFGYHDKIKKVVAKGVDKNAMLFKSASPELKDLIEMREIEISAMKNLSPAFKEEMNSNLHEYGYQLRLQEIVVDKNQKAPAYVGKSPSQISEIILHKATYKGEEDSKEISPYQRRYMTLGLMYALGEESQKNDDTTLFRQYMKIYFNEDKVQVADIPEMQKKYGWNEFKSINKENAATIYQDISQNAPSPDVLKMALLEGRWTDTNENSVHHNLPRRFGACFKDPNVLNNQTNLAVTAQWKVWEEDKHQMEHFWGMSQYEGVGNFLTQTDGVFSREDVIKNLNEIYYEKPQDTKGNDLIPDNTLYLSSNVTVTAPIIPEKAKHLLLEEFKPVFLPSKEEKNSGKIFEINPMIKQRA